MDKNRLILVASTVLLLLPLQLNAAWVDDWLQQKTTTAPNYLQGQQRGYYSAGSFSARWPNTATYPITVESPRVKGGCGGIDLFMGGFSFMDSSYLVNKLQGILSGAASVAFDMALKTLCEQCANTIKNFEALSDQLNSMQIDDCAASKELVGMVMDENGFHSTEVMKERLGTAIKENKLSQGIADMWHQASEQDKANNNVPQAGDISNAMSGCNFELTSTFLASGSLLDNVGSKMGVPANHIDLIRGLIGDVKLEGAVNAYKVTYESPCSENNPDDIKSFANGDVYAKASGGNCHQITDTNRDLNQYVASTLLTIANKVENKGTLTTTEQTFLATSPLAALPIIKTAVTTDMKAAVIGSLADITAKAYALQMLSDLYVRAEIVARKAREMLEKQSGPAPGQPTERCAAVIFAQKADLNISLMISRIRELQGAARASYVAAAKEMSTIMNYLEHMQKVEAQMTAELTRRYGKDVVARLQI